MRRPVLSAVPALLCLTAAAACGDALAPIPADGPPRALAYSAGGYGGTQTTLRLAGDTVVLVTRDFARYWDSTVVRHVPTAAAWRAFWEAVRDAGVRRWPAECTNPDVVDGGGFSFELAWADARRAGAYGNAYPTRQGRCRRDPTATDEARTFQAAMLAVAGVTVVLAATAR